MNLDYKAAQALIDAILAVHNEAGHGCHIVIDATAVVDAAVPKLDYEAAEERAANIVAYICSHPQMSAESFEKNIATLVKEITDASVQDRPTTGGRQ